MLRLAVILGSTRPGRNGEAVAKWVYDIAKKRTDAEFEYIDIKDYNLPLLDELIPSSLGQYSKEHTKAWAAKIDSFDAFVFVTAEYNHGIPGALKNAIDFLFKEWHNKVAGVKVLLSYIKAFHSKYYLMNIYALYKNYCRLTRIMVQRCYAREHPSSF